MDITRVETSVGTSASVFDTVARSLYARLPRRRVAGLLAAAVASSVFGVGPPSGTVEAGRKRARRGSRRVNRRIRAEALSATSIPPNCIFVCCEKSCKEWKMCLRCVKWPKPPTTGTITAG